MSTLPSYVKRCLLEHVRGTHSWIEEKDISPEEQQQYKTLTQRFMDGEPLSRIVGTREFWSLLFQLSPATLDPRADSETLIEAILAQFPNKNLPLKILDLGTGSGCLLLATLSEYPNAHGVGTDIQPEAIEMAAVNAKALGLDNRCNFIQTSWGEGLGEEFAGQFDVILCNPPYIRTDEFAELDDIVKNYDPYISLVSGEDGLECYRQVMPYVERLLAPQGAAFLEIGQGQAEDVIAIGKTYGLSKNCTQKDLAGIDRCIVMQISQ